MRSLGGVYFFDLCVCFLDRERVGVVCLCRFYSVVCVVWHVACGGSEGTICFFNCMQI